MAHNLTENNAIESGYEAMYGMQGGWHGLGRVLDHYFTGDEAKESGFCFTAAKIRQQYAYEGKMLDSDQHVVIRTDTGKALGYVGEDYSLWQNHEAIDFVDALLKDGVMKYDAFFSMFGGQRMTLLARMPEVHTVEEGDSQYQYIMAHWGHGGWGGINFCPTSIRAVCWNMSMLALDVAKSQKRNIVIKHTKNMGGYLKNAADYLSQFNKSFTRYNEQAAAMVRKHYTPSQVSDFLNTLFPVKTEMTDRQKANVQADKDAVLRCLAKENMLQSINGTVWALYNAATRWADHEGKYKGSKVERKDNRWKDITEGTAADFKAQALDLAVSLA